jgi:hypothetical protein
LKFDGQNQTGFRSLMVKTKSKGELEGKKQTISLLTYCTLPAERRIVPHLTNLRGSFVFCHQFCKISYVLLDQHREQLDSKKNTENNLIVINQRFYYA